MFVNVDLKEQFWNTNSPCAKMLQASITYIPGNGLLPDGTKSLRESALIANCTLGYEL